MTGWSYKRRRSHDEKAHRLYLIKEQIKAEANRRMRRYFDYAILYGIDALNKLIEKEENNGTD
jgi:hypothetical protein